MPIGQEAVFVVRLQQEIRCKGWKAREVSEVLKPEAPVKTETSAVWEVP